VEYLAKEELTPLKDPEREFRDIVNGLNSGDWKVLF